jgi:hypothetical protein
MAAKLLFMAGENGLSELLNPAFISFKQKRAKVLSFAL